MNYKQEKKEEFKEFYEDNTIKVHIADDHQTLIDGVTAVLNLEKDIDVIGHSLNGHEVLEWFREHSADVLILDINMPLVDGLDVLRGLNKFEDTPQVVILSSYDDIKLVKEVLKLGALGFIPKKSAGEHIVNAIRNVAKNYQYFSDEIKDRMMKSLMGKPLPKANPEAALIRSLTPREFQVLKLIAQQYTTREMAKELSITESTVESHRKNLIGKVRVKNSVGLAIFAMKNDIL